MSSTKKEAQFAGADNLTPSIPQYFSWINSTNEGSTEVQTLINLDYFRYMRDTYGMQIKIYAWDAGNFDGASMGFGDVNSEKFKSQYPEGYKNVVQAAKEIGIRMGLWAPPTALETTPKQSENATNSLCICAGTTTLPSLSSTAYAVLSAPKRLRCLPICL